MPSLNMSGPFDLDSETIDIKVTKTSAGNYGLGQANQNGLLTVCYVGRSDNNVNNRLKQHIGKYKHFKFSYANSAKEAFEKECQNYHDFKPKDNEVHPDRPDGTDWKCPLCSNFE